MTKKLFFSRNNIIIFFLHFPFIHIKFVIKLNISEEDFDPGCKLFDAPIRTFECSEFRIKDPYGRNLKLTCPILMQYFKLRAFLACPRHQEPQSRDPVDT